MAIAKSIVVDLERQLLKAFEGPATKYEFHCVSGDATHPTPVGKFKVLRKHRKYTSKKYKVPMDFAMFFTTTGEAIHEAHLVAVESFAKYFGIRALGSHGCVRLSSEDAQTLFEWTPMGTPVEVK